jgi:competence protein ComEC
MLLFLSACLLIFFRYKTRTQYFQNNERLVFSSTVTVSPEKKYDECRVYLKGFTVSSYNTTLCNLEVGQKVVISGIFHKEKYGNSIMADSVLVQETPWYGNLLHLLFIKKQQTKTMVGKYLPQPHAGLLLGITLGEKNAIPKTFYDNLVKTGTVHVAVVSGYNVTLVISLLLPFFNLVSNKLFRFCGISLFVFLYAVLVGISPPVIRAVLMGLINFTGLSLGRQTQAVRILLFSSFMMLLFDPRLLWEISFQLSFGATLGMLLFYEKLKNMLKINLLGLEDGLYGCISSQIVVLPLISFYFGRVSLISFVSNFLTLWVIPLSTLSGVVYFVLMGVPVVRDIATFVVYLQLNFFIVVNDFLSDISFSQIEFRVGFTALVLYYTALLAVICRIAVSDMLKGNKL